jgi:hypothetical protein
MQCEKCDEKDKFSNKQRNKYKKGQLQGPLLCSSCAEKEKDNKPKSKNKVNWIAPEPVRHTFSVSSSYASLAAPVSVISVISVTDSASPALPALVSVAAPKPQVHDHMENLLVVVSKHNATLKEKVRLLPALPESPLHYKTMPFQELVDRHLAYSEFVDLFDGSPIRKAERQSHDQHLVYITNHIKALEDKSPALVAFGAARQAKHEVQISKAHDTCRKKCQAALIHIKLFMEEHQLQVQKARERLEENIQVMRTQGFDEIMDAFNDVFNRAPQQLVSYTDFMKDVDLCRQWSDFLNGKQKQKAQLRAMYKKSAADQEDDSKKEINQPKKEIYQWEFLLDYVDGTWITDFKSAVDILLEHADMAACWYLALNELRSGYRAWYQVQEEKGKGSGLTKTTIDLLQKVKFFPFRRFVLNGRFLIHDEKSSQSKEEEYESFVPWSRAQRAFRVFEKHAMLVHPHEYSLHMLLCLYGAYTPGHFNIPDCPLLRDKGPSSTLHPNKHKQIIKQCDWMYHITLTPSVRVRAKLVPDEDITEELDKQGNEEDNWDLWGDKLWFQIFEVQIYTGVDEKTAWVKFPNDKLESLIRVHLREASSPYENRRFISYGRPSKTKETGYQALRNFVLSKLGNQATQVLKLRQLGENPNKERLDRSMEEAWEMDVPY